MERRIAGGTMEMSKAESYSIESIIKKIDSGKLRNDHPTQREDKQWQNKEKGNLISDILQGNPLPELVFAEQIFAVGPVIWNIDGKQRTSIVREFFHDEFKVSKAITRSQISYFSICKDENGKIIKSELGIPEMEKKVCDIRNKRYSDLPDELKERFKDFTFKVTLYLNCSDEDISYHIARYNSGKPMNKAQKSVTVLGTKLAAYTKSISRMPFFAENDIMCGTKQTNGTTEGIVIESVMTTRFLDKWLSGKNAEFLQKNATEEDFQYVEDNIIRLGDVAEEEDMHMFTVKDTFIWVGLFEKFTHLNLADEKFMEFMRAFDSELKFKKIENYVEGLGTKRSTKDKNVVIGKIEFLNQLMLDYFGIEPVDPNKEDGADPEDVGAENTNDNVFDNASEEVVSAIKEFVNTSIVQEVMPEDFSDDDATRLAMTTALRCEGLSYINDLTIRNYMENSANVIDKLEDIILYCDALADYSVEIDRTKTELISVENLPDLIVWTKSFFNSYYDDALVQEWFGKFAEEYKGGKLDVDMMEDKLNRFMRKHDAA